jgi:hypothetical protein
MDAGHQVQTMDESDALRLCGDWLKLGLRGGSEARRAFVGRQTRGRGDTEGHCDLDARARPF